jgi:hypothetical protein
MDTSTPLDKIFSLASLVVILVAVLFAISHGGTSSIIKTSGTQFNNMLKAMEAA